MPVESILRQFDEKWPDDSPARRWSGSRRSLAGFDGGPSRGWAGAMTWLLIVGMVVLFLMWWRGYLDEIVPQQIRAPGSLSRGAPARGDAREHCRRHDAGRLIRPWPTAACACRRHRPRLPSEPEPAPA